MICLDNKVAIVEMWLTLNPKSSTINSVTTGMLCFYVGEL